METDLNPLNSAEVFTMPKEQALREFDKYRGALVRSRSAQDKAMADAYKALAKGQGIINIFAAIKKAGCDKATGLPLLGVMRADEPVCWFQRHNATQGVYGAVRAHLKRFVKGQQAQRRQFVLPDGTLPNEQGLGYEYVKDQEVYSYWRTPSGYKSEHRAPVPPIPPQHRPSDAKSRYLILWHVEKWEMVAPVDPMLIRPITGLPGLGVVVAHWDLTPVEQMVMGALLGQ